MRSEEIRNGRHYAFRHPPTRHDVVPIKVRIVGPARRGKVRARYESGELAGLEEWLPTRDLICSWGEVRAYVRDEKRLKALQDASASERVEVVEAAINCVLAATGEDEFIVNGIWQLPLECARRLWSRAAMPDDPAEESLAFVTRHGHLTLPYMAAYRFAVAFAAKEPEPCLMEVATEEDRYRAEGYTPGQRYMHQLFIERSPSWALVRQWASQSYRDLLAEQVRRLSTVLDQAISTLEALGAIREANHLRRAQHGQ